MADSLVPTPDKSKIIRYEGMIKLLPSPLTPQSNPYAGNPGYLTRYIIGKDYSHRALPNGTREVHDFRLVDEESIFVLDEPAKITLQMVRYVNTTYPISRYDKFLNFTSEGNVKINHRFGGLREHSPHFIDILVEAHPSDQIMDLEISLGIKDVTVIPHPKTDFSIIRRANEQLNLN